MAIIQGDEGTDFLIGTPRDDQISGAGSGDFIFGGGGDDLISGDAGNDVMSGGNGSDGLSGDAGNDVMGGGNGSDFLSGGAGNDVMRGGNGDDGISGEAGNDLMTGGNGADTFYFRASTGHDIIVDFEKSEGDLIGILRGNGFERASYNPFLRATTIDWAGDNSVTFLNATVEEVLTSFVFPE